jgi:hypothetical protein
VAPPSLKTIRKRSAAAAAGEGVRHRVDQGLVVGAPDRHEIGAERGKEFAQDFVIGAERRLEKRGAGETDQPDPFARELIQERLDQELGPLQPGWLDVGGEHGAREVERDHDLPRLLENRFVDAAPLRPGQGDDGEGEAEAKPGPGHSAGSGGGGG